MLNKKVSSYTAASGGFPIKIFKNFGLLSSIINHQKISPIHLQLNPTNHCNLKCGFCSCSERDKLLQLSKDQITVIFGSLHALGCRAVTITGGGEPLLWKEGDLDFRWIIGESLKFGISAGLVTNGYMLRKFETGTLDPVTWVRISASDETDTAKLFNSIGGVGEAQTDWSFSYVVTDKPNVENIANILGFANDHGFTHVRIVNDILRPVVNLALLRDEVLELGASDRLAIWQDRQHYTVGAARCFISLLKPTIGADGLIYPCCGTQYAQRTPDRDYSRLMIMGGIDDIGKIWGDQRYYNGENCVKCYYEHYNTALASLVDDVGHRLFV